MSPAEKLFYSVLVVVSLLTASAVFVSLFFVSAPYGRHSRAGWGPEIKSILGWVVMESPAVFAFLLFFLWGNRFDFGVVWLFVLFWEIHYVHRDLIYPFRARHSNKSMPAMIALFAILFNVSNAYLNGRYLGVFGGRYEIAWLMDPRFILGTLMFFGGMAVNMHSDAVLLRLKRENKGYQVPRAGLFRWVSSPNYFGEIVEWCGWAVLTWSLPGLVFAVWTFANLGPRAWTHHRWYRQTFPDYPAERRALIPYLF